MAQPRGVRNNNPGNIDRHPGTNWQGMAADQSSDPRFVVFKSPQFGIRAIARLMMTYQGQYQLKTVRQLINRWAPPIENNTSAYVADVAARMNIDPDAEIDVDTMAVMKPLVKAIIAHECSGYVYPASVVSEGLHMAGVADAAPPPLIKKPSFQTQIGAGAAVVATAGAHAAQYAPVVKSWADKLSDYTGSPVIQHATTVLLTVAGGLTAVGIVSQVVKQRTS